MIACAPFCMSLLPYVISFLSLSMLLSAIRSVNSDKSSKKSYKKSKMPIAISKNYCIILKQHVSKKNMSDGSVAKW